MTDQADRLRQLVHQTHAATPTQYAPRSYVVVTGGKGGVGASTVATQLAAALAQAGRRTLLVDADLRQADATKIAGVRPTSQGTLAEILAGQRTASRSAANGHGRLCHTARRLGARSSTRSVAYRADSNPCATESPDGWPRVRVGRPGKRPQSVDCRVLERRQTCAGRDHSRRNGRSRHLRHAQIGNRGRQIAARQTSRQSVRRPGRCQRSSRPDRPGLLPFLGRTSPRGAITAM